MGPRWGVPEAEAAALPMEAGPGSPAPRPARLGALVSKGPLGGAGARSAGWSEERLSGAGLCSGGCSARRARGGERRPSLYGAFCPALGLCSTWQWP